jgi:hypothetical protein
MRRFLVRVQVEEPHPAEPSARTPVGMTNDSNGRAHTPEGVRAGGQYETTRKQEPAALDPRPSPYPSRLGDIAWIIGEINHHISPAIGMLRNDDAKGKPYNEERLDGYIARLAEAIQNEAEREGKLAVAPPSTVPKDIAQAQMQALRDNDLDRVTPHMSHAFETYSDATNGSLHPAPFNVYRQGWSDSRRDTEAQAAARAATESAADAGL